MTNRRVRIVFLCEDNQHEAFARRFLEGMGWNTRALHVVKSPSAKGSAEQWVKETFAKELKIYRQRSQRASSALIVMIDADSKTVQNRIDDLEVACSSKGISFRTHDEAVAIAVPKRNIETWIHYLNEQQVNEMDTYQKLDRERGCQQAVSNLVGMCKSTGLKPDAPSSMRQACDEYRNRIKQIS